MAFAAKSTNGCLASSLPSLFTASKASHSHPFPSIRIKPIKLQISCSCSCASSIPLSPILSVAVVAAQKEEDSPVLLEEQEGRDFSLAEAPDSGGDGEETDVFVEPPEEAKLYVGNLPYDVDGVSLAQIFKGAGTVEIVNIICNRETEQSRGFGFVTMSSVVEAEKAVEMFHRYDLNGRLWTVSKAAKRGSKPPARHRIYVGNLPWSVDDARLQQVFSEYGKVVSACVLTERETGRSRGFGFVVMSSEAELNDAIANLDGMSLDGRAIWVNVAADKPPGNELSVPRRRS